MARNVIEIDAPVDVVFDVLLDPQQYPRWVAGAKRIRDVDDTWPAPGSRFHHAVGAGPAEVRDSTKVVEIDPPRRLVLEARFRPPGVACVEMELEPLGTGTPRLAGRATPGRSADQPAELVVPSTVEADRGGTRRRTVTVSAFGR